MKFGIGFANGWPFNTVDTSVALAAAAEQAGFESLWTVEHVVIPTEYESPYPYSSSGKMAGAPDVSIPDPIVWLGWVGARTTSIRLGTGILILPQRNPLVTAKALATLDEFSGGRVEAGVGVGWLREEFEALGTPFEDRGARMDEYIGAMRAVWSNDSASYAGRFVSFDEVNVNPKPVNGTIPITIGGHSPAAARRAGALGDGLYPGRAEVDELRSLWAGVRTAAETAGRDPDRITLSAALPREGYRDPDRVIEQLREIGVRRVIVPAFMAARPDLDSGMERFAEIIGEWSDRTLS
jgi:probable F420-dependent oxidoreductase